MLYTISPFLFFPLLAVILSLILCSSLSHFCSSLSPFVFIPPSPFLYCLLVLPLPTFFNFLPLFFTFHFLFTLYLFLLFLIRSLTLTLFYSTLLLTPLFFTPPLPSCRHFSLSSELKTSGIYCHTSSIVHSSFGFLSFTELVGTF